MSIAEIIREARVPLPVGTDPRWDPPVRDPLAEVGRAKGRRTKSDDLLAEFDRLFAATLEAEDPPADLPEFPLRALPKPLRAWAEAEANRTQTSVDFAALLSLAATSAVIARKIWIEARPGERSPVNLYIGLLGEGSDRGGEVLQSAIGPLRELEREEIERHPVEKALDDRLQRSKLSALALQIDSAAGTEDNEASDDELKLLLEARAEAEARLPLPWPRRILDEVNARNLHRELGRAGRIALFSSQGDVVRQLAGRNSESRGRLIKVLQAAHEGKDLIATMERGRQQYVEQPAITCATIFGESFIAAIAQKRTFADQELLARFLLVAPESKVGRRLVAPPPMPGELAADYRGEIRRLANREATCLVLSPEADQLLQSFAAEIESQLGAGGRLAPIQRWGTALQNQVLRLAANLHVWKSDEKIVARETIAAAIEIGRYLLSHAAPLLEAMFAADDDCGEFERPLLRFARRAKSFSARDAMQHLRRTYWSPENLADALAALMKLGYLRKVETNGAEPGRPASDRFQLVDRKAADAPAGDSHETTESTRNSAEAGSGTAVGDGESGRRGEWEDGESGKTGRVGRRGEWETGRVGDGESGRRGEGETGRVGDGESGRV